MLYSYVYMFLLVLSALCATVVAKGGSLGNLLSGIMPSASLASGLPLSERRNALSFLTMEQRRGLFLRGLEIVPQYPFCREAPSLTLSPHSSPVRFRIVLWARERANQFTVIKTSWWLALKTNADDRDSLASPSFRVLLPQAFPSLRLPGGSAQLPPVFSLFPRLGLQPTRPQRPKAWE